MRRGETAGPSTRTKVLGRDDSIYFVCLSATPGSRVSRLSSRARASVFKSCHPERRAKRGVEGPAFCAVIANRRAPSSSTVISTSTLSSRRSHCHPERRAKRGVEGPAFCAVIATAALHASPLSSRRSRCHPDLHAVILTFTLSFRPSRCHPDRGLQPEWRDLLLFVSASLPKRPLSDRDCRAISLITPISSLHNCRRGERMILLPTCSRNRDSAPPPLALAAAYRRNRAFHWPADMCSSALFASRAHLAFTNPTNCPSTTSDDS